jgi:TonB-linked SusC/RagA family outer membrane protein
MISRIKLIWIVLLILYTATGFSQNKIISGKITDDLGSPMSKITIAVNGTANGVQSDFDGNYMIEVNVGDVLTFSFTGFINSVYTVGASNTIDVMMMRTPTLLDEIILTGVATGTPREKIGIAVNSIKGEELLRNGVQSIDQALQGKIAGNIFQSVSGQPGQQQNIVFRAIGSLNSSQPMILIDGVQILSTESSIGGTSNLSSRLSDIDFANIERIETVAGPASGTIYGAQGANGVINIITKKGEVGAPRVNVRSNIGFSSAITGNKMRRARQHHYVTDNNGFLVDLNGSAVTNLNNQAQYLAVVPQTRNIGSSLLGAKGVNDTPFKERTFSASDILFKKAINSNYGVTVSGGTEDIRYLISGNRSEQESVLVDGKYIKYDAKFNLNLDLTDKLTVNTRFDVVNSSNDTGTNTDNWNVNNLINNAFLNLPHVDFHNINTDGEFTVSPDATDPTSVNPIFFRDVQTRLDKLTRYIANLDINYRFSNNLSFNMKYGYDTYTENFVFFQENQSSHIQAANIPEHVTGIIQHIDGQEYFQNLLISSNLVLDWEEDLDVDVPIITTTTFSFDWKDREMKQTIVSGTNIPNGPFGSNNINQAIVKTFNNYLEFPFRTYGFLVNQKFDFKNITGISVGFRKDFSNRFGSGLSFTFPRVDAYFNFDKFIDSDNINTLKFRTAYGEAGTQPLFSQNIFTFDLTTVGSEAIASIPSTVANANLEVEVSKEYELGLDYSINTNSDSWFSNINGSINYFDRKTTGAIYDSGIATSTGASATSSNAYDISSNGIEFSANLSAYKSDNLTWDFGLRFSKSTAILDNIANGLPLVINDNFVLDKGQEIGVFSVFPIIQNLDATDSNGNRIIPISIVDQFTVASSGYVVDKNSGNVVIGQEKVNVGSTQPDFILNFLNNFTFNDFISVSVQIDWFQGLDVYNRAKQWLYNNALHAETAIPITIEDPTGINQTGAFVSYYTSIYNTNAPTSHFVEDASFIRFRDISVRFSLQELLNIPIIDQLNLTVSGRNLITITDFTGLDPEASRAFGNTFQRGFDEFTHPNTKSLNLGLNVSF